MEYVTKLDSTNPQVAIKSQVGLSYVHPVKYYDFHVYHFAHKKSSVEESDGLRNKLLEEFPEYAANGSIIVKKLPNDKVIGPHPTQFWEVDVCRPEVFVKILSWFQLYHGSLSVLIHPQTGEDLKDHTERALWLGDKLPLFGDIFGEGDEGIPEFGVRGGRQIFASDWDSQ